MTEEKSNKTTCYMRFPLFTSEIWRGSFLFWMLKYQSSHMESLKKQLHLVKKRTCVKQVISKPSNIKLARWCAKWRIKINPEKPKVIIFSRSTNTVRAEPALSLYGDLLSYYPHIKFLGTTIDSKMTFIKQFEDILDRCTQSFIV